MDENNILYFIRRSTEFLQKKSIPSPRLEAEILIAHILNLSRIQLYAKFDMPLTPSQKDQYRDLVKKRGENYPTAYLLGSKNFFGYEYFVDPSVLIPRPETEELVEMVLRDYLPRDTNSPPMRVLDLCCGSGCIGISLLKERPDAVTVDFLDISPAALATAQKNAKALLSEKTYGEIRWFLSDLFSAMPAGDPNQSFDLIVSNPPYVLPEEEASLSTEVRREPRIALVVEEFMPFHKRLLEEALPRLKPDGAILLETNPNCIRDLAELGCDLGYNTKIAMDLSKKERFLIASHSESNESHA